MLTPLEAFTAGLKDASPEQVQAWADACAEVAEAHGVGEKKEKKVKAKKAQKDASEPTEKKNTNPTGPAEFNILIKATWHEMAAQLGVVSDEHDDAFKKAATAAGVSFAKARAEASKRKAALEGREVAEEKHKEKKEKTKVKAAPAPEPEAAAPPALKKPTAAEIEKVTPEYDDAFRARMKADSEKDGLVECVLGGVACWLNMESGEVTSYDGVNLIGAYVVETGEFCAVE
jgi:hypothetical protein